MTCDEMHKEEENPSLCQEEVTLRRPRCGHKLSLRCHEATSLRQRWEEQDMQGVLPPDDGGVAIVARGSKYGKSESDLAHELQLKAIAKCGVKVRYRGACGHLRLGVSCEQAFRWASQESGEPDCLELTSFTSPICGHKVVAKCFVASLDLAPSPFTFSASPGDDSNSSNTTDAPTAHEIALGELSSLPPAAEKALRGRCSNNVMVERRCGHITRMQCSRLLPDVRNQKLPSCIEPVQRRLACGHTAEVECHRQTDARSPACRELVTDKFTYPCGRHSVSPGNCRSLTALRALDDPKCPTPVDAVVPRCGHPITLPCHLEVCARVLRMCVTEVSMAIFNFQLLKCLRLGLATSIQGRRLRSTPRTAARSRNRFGGDRILRRWRCGPGG